MHSAEDFVMACYIMVNQENVCVLLKQPFA